MATTDDPASPAPETVAARLVRRTRLFYGALICGLGVALETVVVAQVWGEGRPWTVPGPLLTVIALAASIGLAYVALNWNAPGGRRIGLLSPPRLWLVGGAAALALLCAAGFYVTATNKPEAEQQAYALIFETPRDHPRALGGGEPSQSGRSGQLRAADEPVNDLNALVWLADQDPPSLPDGALAMFLGGLIIIGFGLGFPTVAPNDAGSALDKAEKFIAPLASAVLVTLGATQQVEATKVRATAAYERQGLPPAVSVAVSGKSMPLRVLPIDTTNKALLDGLAGDVARLQDRYDSDHSRLDDAIVQREVIKERLTAIQNELADAKTLHEPVRVDPKSLEAAITALKDHEQTFKEQLSAIVARDAKQRREAWANRCAGLNVSYAAQEAAWADADGKAREAEAMSRLDRAKRWLSSVASGRKEPSAKQLRSDANRIRSELKAFSHRKALACKGVDEAAHDPKASAP